MRLTASEVDFSYGDRVIADRLSVSVGAGDHVAIIGPSGAGKSTVLGLLGGALAPDGGSVVVEGAETEPPDVVSWIFQTLNVLMDRTAGDNVELGAVADEPLVRRRRERAEEALARVGLGDRVDDPVRLLSGGELQRVVIARALASHRPFILADEPTGQLDAGTSAAVIDILVSATDRGVVVVTHDPEVARRCSRVYRLTDGTLVPEPR